MLVVASYVLFAYFASLFRIGETDELVSRLQQTIHNLEFQKKVALKMDEWMNRYSSYCFVFTLKGPLYSKRNFTILYCVLKL